MKWSFNADREIRTRKLKPECFGTGKFYFLKANFISLKFYLLVSCVCLLFFSWNTKGVCAEEHYSGLLKDKICISRKAIGISKFIRRHVIDNRRQVTIPLTIADTGRVSHRLANAIFKIFLQDVVGYQEVKIVYQEDLMSSIQETDYSNQDEIPDALINLEVWISPGNSDSDSSYIKDRGSQGTGGRFGWYVWPGYVNDDSIFFDHWRSFQNETISRYFVLSSNELDEIREVYAKRSNGTYFCSSQICENGMFIPDICRDKSCGTIFAGQYRHSSFLPQQILYQRLLVQVVWIGRNLVPEFIQKYRGTKPLLFFSWWPSPNSVIPGLLRVAFPSCTEVNPLNSNSFLCKYEMHTLRKHSWSRLQEYGQFAYDAVDRFNLQEEDYHTLLLEYNRLTSYNSSKSFLKPNRKDGWDNDIIQGIACQWLNKTANESSSKIKLWRPHQFSLKPVLWFAGIFPISAVSGKYSSKTLAHAANMAINDINANNSIINDFTLRLQSYNGGCSSDDVLFAFIQYIRAKSLNFNQLIGILGPSCSDTVEPLAGIAKLYDTVIISYSAEGAIINDQEKYPYFFRTIPENILYRYVYLQLFRVLKWKRLASLTEDGNKYSEYLTLLQDNLQAENISIFNRKFPREARKDMATYLKFLKNEHYHIIIGDFYSVMACEIMCEAYKLQMTARQGFIWFLPSWYVPKWYMKCTKNEEECAEDEEECAKNEEANTDCTREQILTALDGHLSLGYAYYASDDYQYHNAETVKQWKLRYEEIYEVPPVDYAGYTYDAVWTYAFALDKLLREKFTHAANMHSNTTTERFVQLLRQTDFKGVSGRINFPKGTSRQTNINILQFRTNASTNESVFNIVGYFNPDDSVKEGGTMTLNESALEWFTPDGKQPGDGTPPRATCVLDSFSKLLGVSCEFTIVITMLISFAIFACFVIVLFCIYKVKYEKIEPPPWQLPNLMNLDEWEIPRERVVINRTIGAGAFGTVYGGECMINEDSAWAAVAVKTLKKGSTAENKLDFLGEADMMKRFDHRNIIKLVGLSTRVEPIYMIMEFMLYGDLQTYLLARRHFVSERTFCTDDDEISNRRLTSMSLDVARALEYLASNKYVHRDVACRNCLVNADRVVKLSDFGMTRPVYENNYYRFNRKGMLPVRWMAPESIEDGLYTIMTDVWSYGVLLYEVITFGNFPFQGLSNNEVLEHVVKHGKTLKIPDGVRPQLAKILHRCWSRIPENRPNFSELCEIFSSYPRLINPCLEVPLASVQTNDSDSLEIGIDPTRKVSVPKGILKQNQGSGIPPGTTQSNTIQNTPNFPTNLSPSNNECEMLNAMEMNSNRSQPKQSLLPRILSSSGNTSKNRKLITTCENGGGPSVEPLLPLTRADSYITRRTQGNGK